MTKTRNRLENGLIRGLSQTLWKASYSILLLFQHLKNQSNTNNNCIGIAFSHQSKGCNIDDITPLRFKLVSVSVSVVKDRVAYRKEPIHWLLLIDINEYCTKRCRAFNDLT